MALRRPPAADPHVLARVAALAVPGWVPPPEDESDAVVPPRAGGRPAVRERGDGRAEPTERSGAARTGAGDDAPPPAPLLSATTGLLGPWRQGRVDPGRRGLAALALVVLLAVALTSWYVVRSRPQEVVVPPPLVGSVAGVPRHPAPAAPAAVDAASGEVVVAVAGRVRRPGLVRLPVGSRVDDAVRAAGGARRPADLALVNLARRLVDGEQVVVGGVPAQAGAVAPGASAPGGAGGPGGAAAGPAPGSGPGAPLDLNAATAAQLDGLPGIGAVLAERIVAWRTEHGRFASVDQLREVDGIGESKFGQLRSRVRV